MSDVQDAIDASKRTMRTLVDQSRAEGRNLTASEARNFNHLEEEIRALQEAADEQRAAEDRARHAEEARQAKAARARVRYGLGDGPSVVVRSEARTYGPGRGHSYFGDLARSSFGDVAAGDRLARHAREVDVEAATVGTFESRALSTNTGVGGTFVPPAYLVSEFVPYAREARPFADACNCQDLPAGTDVINLPKVVTGTAVAPQGTQNTPVLETDLTDVYISAPVTTMAGQQTVSLQLIEQSPINFDEMVMSDLASAHAQTIDSQVLNGSGTAGNLTGVLQMLGIDVITYTSTTPSGTALYPKVAKTLADIRQNRHAAATHTWMTPERWYWLAAQTDANGRPLVIPNAQGPWNAQAAMADLPAVYGPAGSFLGSVVYLDANLPQNLGTGNNQDVVLTAKMDDLYLYESAPVARALPQTLGNQLSVLIQLYSYVAFLPNRYVTSVAAVEGSGLTTPGF